VSGEMLCRQLISGASCGAPSRLRCAACGKPSCPLHLRWAAVPSKRLFKPRPPRFCVTCSRLEEALKRPADQLDDHDRDAFLSSPEGWGLGIVGESFR
jgi:hypothetical protein